MKLLIFFFICFPFSLNAQLHFEIYSLEQLPGTYKARMAQDKFGYLWIPSADGLYRYDGIELKHYYHIASDTNSLSINNVSCVYPDADGTIWAGTFDGGLNHLDPVTGKCKIYKYDINNTSSISGNRILCVFRDSKKRLWISAAGSEAGLNIFNEKKNSFQRIQLGEPSLTSSEKAADNTINFLNEMQNGNLIATTYDGLWIRDHETGKFSVYRCDTSTSRLRNNLMGVTLEYPANTLWICTWGGGLKKFDCATETFQTYLWNNSLKNSGFTNISHDVLVKNKDELWIASVDKGFGTFNLVTKQFTFYSSSIFNYNTATYGAYNLCKVKNGNIWIGLDNSTCAILDLNKQPLPFTDLAFKHSSNFTTPEVNEIVKANDSKYILTTTWMNNVFVFDERTNSLKKCTLSNGRLMQPASLMKDDSGKIWAISGKIYSVNEHTAKLNLFTPLSHANIPSLREGIEDNNHNFWFTTSNGIVCYDNNNGSIFHFTSAQLNLKPSSYLHGLICDDNNNIWVGSDENGLFIFNAITKKYTNVQSNLPFSTITSFTKDARNRIWMCGIGGIAVCIRQGKEWKFKSFSFENGLATNNITSIAFDGKNYIWAIGAGNLSRINANDFSIDNFNADIFEKKSITSVNVNDGKLYLGSQMGFFDLAPYDIHYDAAPPPVVINAFKIFDKVYPLYLPTPTIKLQYNQNYFSFDFAAINFSDAEQCKYAYKLEGFDKQWIYAGNRRYAAYTNIPGGHYTFKIKASNPYGIWNNTGVSVPIFITTPFWKTWWFYTLLAIVIIAAAYALYRYRINQLIKLQNMRAQIASDLHDDIGSTLTSISFYSEMVKMQLNEKDSALKIILEKIGNNARTMVIAMSDIVWMINPDNDVTNNLVAKMKAHAAQLLSERNIHYNFESGEFKKIKLSMQQKKNIYLIYKEALHNAVKYSACSEIEIRFTETDRQINLQLKDNGKGFQPTQTFAGNGLHNMKKRAKDLKADLAIDSKPGNGTSISLYVKIT